ncbi:unnamed protein product [Ectocarpus sp. CCAP 1310/34]|nr:unnamed protein product [Ectocarpus sp. CCAP 1310/34]
MYQRPHRPNSSPRRRISPDSAQATTKKAGNLAQGTPWIVFAHRVSHRPNHLAEAAGVLSVQLKQQVQSMAEDNQTSQDGLIHRVCVEDKGPAQSVATMRRAQRCEYAGCDGTPRYGPRNGLQSFCQGHKRAGMYTYRSGELFMATRDGRVFRKAAGPTATAAAKPVAWDMAFEATKDARGT